MDKADLTDANDGFVLSHPCAMKLRKDGAPVH
jgi:hypothetical protein